MKFCLTNSPCGSQHPRWSPRMGLSWYPHSCVVSSTQRCSRVGLCDPWNRQERWSVTSKIRIWKALWLLFWTPPPPTLSLLTRTEVNCLVSRKSSPVTRLMRTAQHSSQESHEWFFLEAEFLALAKTSPGLQPHETLSLQLSHPDFCPQKPWDNKCFIGLSHWVLG